MGEHMPRYHHGKVQFKWCDNCGTLILGDKCDECEGLGRAFLVSSPGDIRPAMQKGVELVAHLFEKHFQASRVLKNKLIFFNKVAGEDRTDEIVVGGQVIGTLRFDLKRDDFMLDLRIEGARLIGAEGKKNVVIMKPQSGHLKGKSLGGSEVLEVRGHFQTGDPLIVVLGNLLSAADAKVPSGQMNRAERAIHIRDVEKLGERWVPRSAPIARFVNANRSHFNKLESKAVSDVKSFTSSRNLPVTLSFSGGKDSLACFGIVQKALKSVTLLFVNTGLEFPETVSYVRGFARKHGLKLLEADAGKSFWEQVDSFGPPAKDFRWCCKVCKLAPLTEMIERNFVAGTITIEGNRALESFARSDIGFVETNPFVPNQTILNPIRGWRAVDVWGYIWWKNLDYNPLYEEDFERIGCYLCPACLASEWKATSRIHPELHGHFVEYLDRWSSASGSDHDFVRYGFWRWKVLPPKMRKLAEEVRLKVPRQRSDRLKLKMIRGVSPCLTGGYSIEGVIATPAQRPFGRVAEVLRTVGKTRFSPEFEIALTKSNRGTVKVFGGGQVVATGETKEKAERMFEAGVKAFLRAQMCTMCGICVKNCRKGAITIKYGPVVDEERCDQCGKCAEVCVVAHYYDKLVSSEQGIKTQS
jgi:phosphoadenosine phosphosulfate reductase